MSLPLCCSLFCRKLIGFIVGKGDQWGKHKLEMKEIFQKCCHFAFVDQGWGNYLGHLTALQVHHDGDHNHLGTMCAEDAPLAGLPKRINMQSLSFDIQ